METFIIKALQLMLALALLVLVHEFGHYFFSRVSPYSNTSLRNPTLNQVKWKRLLGATPNTVSVGFHLAVIARLQA